MTKPGIGRRLWVVSDIYYPEDVSTGHVMTRFAEGLADTADVNIVCGRPSYAKAGMDTPRTEQRHGTTIRRVGLFAFPKDRLALRALNVASFTLSAFLHLLFGVRRGDSILCVTNPPTLPPLVAMVARWKGARMVLLVHDVFPETAVAAGMLGTGGLVHGLLRGWTGIAYRKADVVAVLGRDMARIATAKRGTPNGVEIIENWADLDEVRPIDPASSDILQELGCAGNRVLQFSGNLGRTHGVEELVEIAGQLGDGSDWRMLIAGFGGKQAIASEGASSLSKLHFIPRQPRERLSMLLGSCDLQVIAFVPGMVGLSVPSRMYNVMAAGRPILAIADRESELALTVTEHDIGWHVEPGNPAAVVRLLETVITREACAEKGARARQLAETRFRFDQMLDRMREALFPGTAA